MARDPDILKILPPELRAEVMRGIVFEVFGDRNGARVWQQLEAGLTYTARQLGDHREPDKNFWKGAWRIYEFK